MNRIVYGILWGTASRWLRPGQLARRRARHSRRIVGIFVGALCLAVVGSQTAQAAAPVDACALLRRTEISPLIGLDVRDGQRQDGGLQADGSYSSTCVWTIRVGEDAPVDPSAPLGGRSFVILNVLLWPEGSGLARTFIEAFYRAAERGEIPSTPAVRDLGDEALWWGDGLAVRQGDVSFGVSVFMARSTAVTAPRPGAFEERLAPLILERLKESERGAARSE
jgi:hypothetical protein